MSEPLKACPFCGGIAEIERPGTSRQSSIIVCTNCGCRLESNEVEWTTGMNWNRRVPENIPKIFLADDRRVGA